MKRLKEMTKTRPIPDVPLSEWTMPELKQAIRFYNMWIDICSKKDIARAACRIEELMCELRRRDNL